MARNNLPVEDKPVAESSDSEQEQQNNSEQEEQQNNSDQETSSDESESDTADPNNVVKENGTDKRSDGEIGSIPKPTQTESESGSESQTDSDSDRPSYFTIKLINSKQQPPTPLKSNKSPSKRAAETETELGLKALKKAKVEDEGVKKVSAIQRLFSEGDEIALLEGISEFQAKEGIDPYSNISKFHEFIKKRIHFDATSNQLKEKIRRLKGKYQGIVRKSGEDPVFSKSHDLKLFNLSKKLWGNNAAEKVKKSANESKFKGEDGVVTKKQKKMANGGGNKEGRQGKGNNDGAVSEGDDVEEEDQMAECEKGGMVEDYSLKFPLCAGGLMESEGLSEKSKGFLVQNLGLIGKAKLEYYEGELQKIKWAEIELFIKKRELINEKIRLLLHSYKQ